MTYEMSTPARLRPAVVHHVTAVRLMVERLNRLNRGLSTSSIGWQKQILVRAPPAPLVCMPCLLALHPDSGCSTDDPASVTIDADRCRRGN